MNCQTLHPLLQQLPFEISSINFLCFELRLVGQLIHHKHIAKTVYGKTKFKYLGNEIELDGKWKRVSMVEAIKEKTGIDFKQEMSLDDAKKLAKEHNVEVEPHFTVGHIINAFFEKYVEETLIQPTFLYGHPVEISPLTRANQ